NEAGMMSGYRFKGAKSVKLAITRFRIRRQDLHRAKGASQGGRQPDFSIRTSPNGSNQIMIRNLRHSQLGTPPFRFGRQCLGAWVKGALWQDSTSSLGPRVAPPLSDR